MPSRSLAALLVAVLSFAAAADLAAADRPPRSRPVIVVAGSPPAELQTRDLKRGKGLRARRGDALRVHYVMATWSDGREKDSSFGRGEPFEFPLGAGQVIEGWDRALVGMRTGGRRRLILPPALAYGDEGAPPAVGPGETLVFVVDLVRVCRGTGRARRCG